MSAPAMPHEGAEEVELVLRMRGASVCAPMDPASQYVSLWANSDPSSRRGFAACP